MKSKNLAIVGAGAYGLEAAIKLGEKGHNVTIIEKNSGPMLGASLINQGRVHNGHHYPRSLKTAIRSNINFDKFLERFGNAITPNKSSIYGIARDSRTSPSKFRHFSSVIGSPVTPAGREILSLFDNSYVSELFLVEEVQFDANKLKLALLHELSRYSIEMLFECEVISVKTHDQFLSIEVDNIANNFGPFDGVIIATYGQSSSLDRHLKVNTSMIFEVCELVEVIPPNALREHAITIMDGPYWSLTPWPVGSSHVLSHVRHTPHSRFSEVESAEKYMKSILTSTRSELMVRDASKYCPQMRNVEVVKSHYVIKSIPPNRDHDDGRPILHHTQGRVLSIIGSKIDNIFDIEALIDDFAERL